MKHIAKNGKKTLKSVLAAMLVFAILITGTGGLAYGTAAAATPKEEVIYVTADAKGDVKELNAVNIFDGGEITDYGDYSAVKLLTGEGKISKSGKKISVEAENEKIYYQGTMKTTEIPWNISIRYYMDGKEYEPEEIAGKSGKLKIHFVVTKNSRCAGDFYENYALQAAFTLDTEKCRKIKAEDATVANVGQDKQLSYILLPGKGIDTYITAEVEDFEMDAVSINGIKLNLNIEVDYTDMDKKADDAKDAARELDDGAGEAEDGAEKIAEAARELTEKFAELGDGTAELGDGAEELFSGMTEITDKNTELTDGAYKAFEGICEASETMINEKLTESGMSTISLTPKNYAAEIEDLLDKLDPAAVYNKAYTQALRTVTAQVEANADPLYYAAAEKIVEQQMTETAAAQAQQEQQQAQQAEQQEKQIGAEGTSQTAGEERDSGSSGDSTGSSTEDSTEPQQQPSSGDSAEEQKQQAIAQVLAAMTEEQKAQIKSAAIKQGIASSDVTSRISAAVSTASKASAQIEELKEQLDEYQKFYDGVCDYTDAVSEAKDGAGKLLDNMETLEENTGLLKDAMEGFCKKMEELRDGISKLKEGTAEFFDEISGLKGEIHDKVSEMIDELKGNGILRSFTSNKNTEIESLQFVIKTEAISMEEPQQVEATTETLSFWQKLIRLFTD